MQVIVHEAVDRNHRCGNRTPVGPIVASRTHDPRQHHAGELSGDTPNGNEQRNQGLAPYNRGRQLAFAHRQHLIDEGDKVAAAAIDLHHVGRHYDHVTSSRVSTEQ